MSTRAYRIAVGAVCIAMTLLCMTRDVVTLRDVSRGTSARGTGILPPASAQDERGHSSGVRILETASHP